MKEKKDRVDDALRATRAAIEEGIVAGGGVAYIRAQKTLEGMKGDNADETTGIAIIRRAIEEPLRQICRNAGIEGAVIVNKVREGEGNFGYNAKTEEFGDLRAAGVVDPAKVTRVALENCGFCGWYVLDYGMRHLRQKWTTNPNCPWVTPVWAA